MTSWQPIPIRKLGQPWSGMDSAGGKIDNGTGQLNENSVNCTINEVDTLSKRLGFIRGQNERFGTAVCGLHTYTDNCGQQWLLVVSDEGISIRQPFDIPVFENDDSYPIDGFDDATGLSALNWRNTDLYAANGSALLRTSGNSTSPFDPASFLRWFKDASSLSYSVTIQYELDTAGDSVVSICIRGNGDLTTGRRIQADLQFLPFSETYVARVYKVDLLGNRSEIATIDVDGSKLAPSGFMTLSYSRNFNAALPVFTATLNVTSTGGSVQEASSTSFSELEDSELGRVSAIGCSTFASILQVFGGPV